MATVYLAHDVKHDRAVALKVLRPELAAVLGAERFLQEIRTTASLQHPHILPLYDSGEAGGLLFYTMPHVAGESLRHKLTRERQLGLEEALTITRQAASALDYAHRQGVIHRDIKPENILLHEGEAVVADFGIALAVRQAGGQRLTESGLSLGTPQYMSPEQATGDRELDARSDVYSLGAVLYEMLAGEPPVTGPTVQAVIAKLLTERPTRLRTLRDTVPEGIDAAVAKALAKVPADRFASMEAFAQALAGGSSTPAIRPSVARGRARVLAIVVVLTAAGLWAVLRGHKPSMPAAYLERTQVTFTGDASQPALSPDGSELAYVVTDCSGGPCRYGIRVQDLSGEGSRRLVTDAAAIARVGWPDRRFLWVSGDLGSGFGWYLVPVLGGLPRLVTRGGASVVPGSDSLLLTEVGSPWIRVAALDGEPRDSFRIQHADGAFLGAIGLPGDRWTLVGYLTDAGVEMRLVDRHGVAGDRIIQPSMPPRISSQAIWFSIPTVGTHAPLARLPVDLARGTFTRSALDTILDTPDQGFDVTRDGRTLAYADGTYRYELWMLDVDDALRGRFARGAQRQVSTSWLTGIPSPDGSQVLVARTGEGSGADVTIMPWGGGTGIPIRRRLLDFEWVWDGRVLCGWAEGTTYHFGTANPATGDVRSALAVSEPDIIDLGALANSGWVWIPLAANALRVQYPSDTVPRYLPAPEGVRLLVGLRVAPDGRRIATAGLGRGDSLLVHEIALPRGTVTRLGAFPMIPGPIPFNHAQLSWLRGGALLVAVEQRSHMFTLYRVDGPGHADRLGTIPRPTAGLDAAPDGRLAVTTLDFRGDIWLARRSGTRH